MIKMRKSVLLFIVLLCGIAQGTWAQNWTDVSSSSELTSAIIDGAYIRLTNNITLSRYLGISGDKTVTIDLNGNVLKRNISSIAGDGNVIRISSGSTLTIQDGSGDNSGQITGGFSSDGGGINNSGTLHFKGGTITGCRVDHEGGAILNSGTMTMSGGVISACRGNDCGGIYTAAGSTLTITGGTITGCFSNAGGAAIINHGTADISGCTFSNNTATTRGGAIWSDSDLTISNCTFTGNEAEHNDGGAIHLNGGTATLTDVTISNNTSPDAGGIYVDSGATLNLGGTSAITDNHSAEHGGGGIDNYGTVALSGTVSITGNTCHGYGAGIWSNGTLKMEGNINISSNITDNGVSQNVFLKSGKVITVTGPFTSGTRIGVLIEDSEGKFTADYSNYNSGIEPSTYFTADQSNQIVTLVDGEASLIMSGEDVYYIEREWDEENKVVKATQKPLADFTELTGNNSDDIYNLESGKWYVVRSNVVYKKIIAPTGSPAHLVLCDGASLTCQVTIEESHALNIYGQVFNSGRIVASDIEEPLPLNEPPYHQKISSAIGYAGKMGTLVIHGGTINATSGNSVAAIGGGKATDDSGQGGHLTILGGTVTATGGDEAAGIGGPYGGDGGVTIIYGGTVTARGGDYSAGIGGGKFGDGGTLTVNGGFVYAYGGEYGAGIGGGSNADGADVTVNGGYVYAKAGTDAAGIGSGEQSAFYSPYGGSLTVTGGEVHAFGDGWGAGIGGGEDADGADVLITGGIVEATAGEDVADKNGGAIGSEDGDGHRGTLRFGDDMKVSAGQSSNSTTVFTSDQRVPACWFRPFARIEPCDHAGATYSIADNTHTMHCRYCTYSPTEEHTFVDGICTVCGASGSVSTVSIYLPEAVDGHYTDGHYASEPHVEQFATGTVISLPAPPVSYLPNGVTFAGWAVGTPTELGITSYWMADGETVLEAGSEYTLNADVNLTARYTGINIILADDDDNSEILYQNKGKKAQSVTLMGRTLHKDGSWNTLFLPFSLTAEQIAESPLAGAVLMTLDESTFNEVTRELTITFEPTVSIEAGMPYIVKWTDGTDIENPVFNNVTINNAIANSSTTYVDFIGTYSPELIYQDGNVVNKLYLDGNALRFPTSGQAQVNACRAYFELRNMVMPGDVNSDDYINIADVTTLIDILLGQIEDNAAADVNGDGQTNISDVTKLIDALLGVTSISPVTHIETNVGITME